MLQGTVRFFTTILATCLFATVSQAQSEEDSLWAVNELSVELQQCSQYLLISSICMKDFPNPDAPALATDYLASANRIGELAFSLAGAAGISSEATKARMRLINVEMMKSIDDSCGNISILIERYSSFCKAMLKDPAPRLKELTECAANKQTLPCGDR
jgi:hypothetical protein